MDFPVVTSKNRAWESDNNSIATTKPPDGQHVINWSKFDCLNSFNYPASMYHLVDKLILSIISL